MQFAVGYLVLKGATLSRHSAAGKPMNERNGATLSSEGMYSCILDGYWTSAPSPSAKILISLASPTEVARIRKINDLHWRTDPCRPFETLGEFCGLANPEIALSRRTSCVCQLGGGFHAPTSAISASGYDRSGVSGRLKLT